METTLRQLEREKALLQHKSVDSHRRAESEADRKRCLENEVNSLRDQLDEMKKKNQNSHISNEKNIHLQKQVCGLEGGAIGVSTYLFLFNFFKEMNAFI